MNREELRKEIIRVETALRKTTSKHLRKDYSKYLRRLRKELDFYDRCKLSYAVESDKR